MPWSQRFSTSTTRTNHLKGLLSLHVDDAFITGEGPMFDASLTALEKALGLTFKYGEFVYCGKKVKQDDDYSITVT